MPPLHRTTTVAALLLSLSAAAVAAQQNATVKKQKRDWPFDGSLSLTQLRPAGDYAKNVDFAYGAMLSFAPAVEPSGFVKVRTSIAGAHYGSESSRVLIGGGRVSADLVTRNLLFYGDIGPQLTIPLGNFRPYAHAGVGLLYYTTDSHLAGNDDDDSHTTNNFSDASWTRSGGGGFRLFLSRGDEGLPVWLDVGATHYFGGHARYLRPGRIYEGPDGKMVVDPYESDVRFTAVRIGVTIGR